MQRLATEITRYLILHSYYQYLLNLSLSQQQLPIYLYYMDDMLLRFKPRRQYQWYQDQTAVFLGLQFKNTSLRKFAIELTDLALKVNHRQRKHVIIIDLLHPIDPDNPLNEVTYSNNMLRFKMIKAVPQHWQGLEVELPHEQRLARREESFRRKEEKAQKLKKVQQDIKHEYDRKATQEIMRHEEDNRKKIDSLKKQEREEEEQRIFGTSAPLSAPPSASPLQQRSSQVPPSALPTEQQEREIERKVQRLQEQQRIKQKKEVEFKKAKTTDKNLIFTPEDAMRVEHHEEEQQEFQKVPARESGKVSVKFTERVFPHLAARQQHFNEPPMPKPKKGAGKGQELEQRNPLFLKDKADRLFLNGDFYSAINAYSQVIKIDQEAITARSNRALCHMRLFNYQQALADSNQVLSKIAGKEEHAHLEYKTKLRVAVCHSWAGRFSESKVLLQQVKGEESDKVGSLIESRLEQVRAKEVADLDLKNGFINQAIDKYRIIVGDNSNEFVHANLALALLKKEEFEDSANECSKALTYMQKFTHPSHTEHGLSSTCTAVQGLFFKCFLRRATARKKLGFKKYAAQDIKQALLIDPRSQEARQFEEELKKEQMREETTFMREKAKQLLQEGRVEQALQQYNECLKKLPQSEVMDYLTVLQNRLVCFLKLDRADDIISTCIRGIKIVRNHRERIVSFDNARLDKDQHDKLVEMEVRFLVRRANAYLKTGQFYNCKADLDEALGLNPVDGMRKEVERLVGALQQSR